MKIFKPLFILLGIYLFNNSINAQSQELYLIKSPENNLVMEVDNKKMNYNGVKVYLKKQNGKDTQKWIFTVGNDGYTTIKNLASGKVMSILSYNQSTNGNPLVLNDRDGSRLQKWSVNKSFSTDKVKIENVQNSKLLVPKGNAYKSAARILLNSAGSFKKQEWVLVPVTSDDNVAGGDYAGLYKNESSGLDMEIRSMGGDSYKAFFKGSCTDESLTGRADRYGTLILPMNSSNNARLEISKSGNRIRVKISNLNQMSSRSYGKCSGGTIQGYYKMINNTNDFTGSYQMSYGNQSMEIVKSGYNSFKAVFKGNCNAETLTGNINRRGELEIPLRGGYNDKMFIRKNGNQLNVSVTNKNVLNICSGGTLEGNYTQKSITTDKQFAGRYKARSGRQEMEIVKSGYNGYKVVFNGNCRAETQAGRINSRGILVIPLKSGYNDTMEISIEGNRVRVYVNNRNHMLNVCNGQSIDGYYDRDSWNNGGGSSNVDFNGKYQLDMQHVQLVNVGGNRYKAIFFGDCELTTKTGTVNYKGELEIPFEGENMMQKMIVRKRSNGIEIRNTSNSPMMGLCKGSTLAGFYTRR